MSTYDPYKQSFGSSGGGWICSRCGMWIPNGELHMCVESAYVVEHQTTAYNESALFQVLEILKTIQMDLKSIKEKLGIS